MAVVRWSPVQERAQDFAVFGKDLRVYRYELKVQSSVLRCTACAEYLLYLSYNAFRINACADV